MPTAIGALCLNQAGLDQIGTRSTIIPTLFSILTSERHIKTLNEKDNAVYLGAAMDELMRHHPTLKEKVFASVKGVFERIQMLGRELVIPTPEAAKYGLKKVDETHEVEKNASPNANEGRSTPAPATQASEARPTANGVEEAPTNPIIAYIDTACRVCTQSLPSLAYDFSLSRSSLKAFSNIRDTAVTL